MKFIDEVTIKVVSGHGGPGHVGFRKESNIPRGGPDGGDGGKGGDVIIRVNSQLSSLLDLRYKRICQAEDGEKGGLKLQTGQNGRDYAIDVPLGTLVKLTDGQLLCDLNEEGAQFTVAQGGRGGKGNHFFKTSVNQAPTYAQPGEPGEENLVHLELKLLADVGIIGFPNAGKSTLISRISSAKPKIANYEFTTLVPNLGVVSYGDFKSFVVADIPGLIKGASEGIGLGIQFLKHVERTELFLHLIDVSSMNYRDPLQDYYDLREELALYDKKYKDKVGVPLSLRQEIIVLNKIDTLSKEEVDVIVSKFNKKSLYPRLLSAVTGSQVKELIFCLGDALFKKEE